MIFCILLCVLIPSGHGQSKRPTTNGMGVTDSVTLTSLQNTLEQEVLTRKELQKDMLVLKAQVQELLSYKSGYDELKANYMQLRHQFPIEIATLHNGLDNLTAVCQSQNTDMQTQYDAMKQSLQNVTSQLNGVQQELQQTKQMLSSSQNTNPNNQNVSSSLHSMEMLLNKQKASIVNIENSLGLYEKRQPFVAIYARLTADVQPTEDEKMVFNNVNTNIGQAYDTSTGIVTATAAGIYSFECTITTQHGDPDAYIMVNAKPIMPLFDHSDDTSNYDYRQASASVTVHLNFGDKVWVEWNGSTAGATVKARSESFFSGHLVRAD